MAPHQTSTGRLENLQRRQRQRHLCGETDMFRYQHRQSRSSPAPAVSIPECLYEVTHGVCGHRGAVLLPRALPPSAICVTKAARGQATSVDYLDEAEAAT